MQEFARLNLDRRTIRACVPVHTFGHPVNLTGLKKVAKEWGLKIMEDSTEALGSLYKKRNIKNIWRFWIFKF